MGWDCTVRLSESDRFPMPLSYVLVLAISNPLHTQVVLSCIRFVVQY